MTYNTNFSWDFDPSNGITPYTYSFQDVIIHEVGHALGFTSAAAQAILQPLEASETAATRAGFPGSTAAEGTGGELVVAQAKAAGAEYLMIHIEDRRQIGFSHTPGGVFFSERDAT